ncbi:hypothetical protein [Botrimarina sp.]|uniref:hypothetical protein n=1 Tax=Botrimarina sp. TaxID=2795802 RepID=UPI0032EDF8DF
MLPERYRRLWRRRVRRRPLVPLLIAATVAVNAVIAVTPLGDPESSWRSFLIGVSIGQVGLLGAWIPSRRVGVLIRIAVSVPLGVIAIVLMLLPSDLGQADELLPFAGIVLAAAAAACGLIEAAHAAWKPRGLRRVRRKGFSMAVLVGAMLVAPPLVLVPSLDAWKYLITWEVLGPIAIETGLLAAFYAGARVVREPALYGLGCIASQLPLAAFATGGELVLFDGAYYLGHATVIGAWLTGLKVRGRGADRRAPAAAIDLRA